MVLSFRSTITADYSFITEEAASNDIFTVVALPVWNERNEPYSDE